VTRVRPTNHQRQVLDNSCVTACGCMVLRALGEDPDERALHLADGGSADAGRNLHELLTLHPALRDKSRLVKNLKDEDVIVELGEDRALAVLVRTQQWESELRENGYQPPSGRSSLHAVLLIGIEEELGRQQLVVLDPALDGVDGLGRSWVPIYLALGTGRDGFVLRWVHMLQAVVFDFQ